MPINVPDAIKPSRKNAFANTLKPVNATNPLSTDKSAESTPKFHLMSSKYLIIDSVPQEIVRTFPLKDYRNRKRLNSKGGKTQTQWSYCQ